MVRKAQISLFIALGIVIIIFVVVIIFLQTSVKEGQKEKEIKESFAVTADGLRVSNYVKSCMDLTVKSGVLLIELQGGYTDTPPNYFSSNYSDIAYYYDNGQFSIVNISVIENQLKKYVNANFESCINNFSAFTEKGVVVNAGRPSIDLKIDNLTGIDLSLNYSVEVGRADKKEELSIFRQNYKYRIGTIMEVAQKILDSVKNDPTLIPVEYMVDLSEQYNVKINALTYYPNKIVYIIEDPEAMTQEKTPFLFLFAVRTKIENNLPIINVDESKLTGKIGQYFNLTVKATDADYDPIKFYTDSDLIGIDLTTGEVAFTPEQARQYNLTVIASDGKGNSTKQLTITII